VLSDQPLRPVRSIDPRRSLRLRLAIPAIACALVAIPSPAWAYIGPGAGFALLSSFFGIAATLVLAIVSLLRWPFRVLWRMIRRRARGRAHIRRLVIVGFDGQEPTLTDAFLRAGHLPHFARLAATGCYHRLRTTSPPVSPVAWSSFATGTDPGRHGIFDFIDRDPRTYLPRISSTRIGTVTRALTLGPFRIPLGKPVIRLLRKSPPFWSLLGDARIWSTVLRVPITFPPDRFYGAQLSAMAAPDLLGTQGTFFVYSTRPAKAGAKEAGVRIPLAFDADLAVTRITGPGNPLKVGEPPLDLEMRLVRDPANRTVTVELPGQRVRLAVGELSEWISLAFRAAPFVKVRGLCRMQVTELDEHVTLYVTPISLDPERPVMPISHPSYYASYLAKKIGPYSTLGLAEDTGALNDGIVDDETFLKQTWDIEAERQAMFFAALDRLQEGALVCVFDATDRVQHMFWRDIDSSHPAGRGRDHARRPNAIEEQYRRNDAFLGRVIAQLGDGDLLMVLSDHGFTAFRRGVNLNRWLLDRGLLALKPGGDASAEWLKDVDWSRTRAYALGLTGIFLNLKGRERHGIVDPADAAALKAELIAALQALKDPDVKGTAIHSVRDTAVAYDGPYVDRGPDLLVGYNTGYRVSWDCASGIVAGPLFSDNLKRWSGDHCIDSDLVPGVFLCSKPINRAPAIIDIAPTALWLFGVEVPRHVQGRALFDKWPTPTSSVPGSVKNVN
jgi:predicted AlkP superfamily phosphohydrolase/phosphomutase